MRAVFRGLTLALLSTLFHPGSVPAADEPPKAAGRPPNVVVILADDLGYSDLGCYGGEVGTPNLDALAAGGLRFAQFYNTARCWPTRASLLTGYYAQQVRRDTVPGVPSGNRGVRPKWARLLPEMLRPLGYRSYHSGKWHVDGMPLANGFDHSYYLQDLGRYFSPRVLFEDDRRLPPVAPGSGYYATTAIADHGIKYLKGHAEEHPGRPFFLFLAFNAPHFPLQALPEDIARYRDRYRGGWEAARAERWRRVQDLELVRGRLSEVERGVGPPYDFPDALKALGPGEVNRPLPWGELTDEQREFQATKMTLHAALVDRMDREVGRVLDQVRAMGAFEDTLIVFLSDNGASAEIMVRDDGHDPKAPPGSAATHLCLGPGWSTVANTPFRRHKTWVHEGGIATPLIVQWPRGLAARGEFRHDPGHVIDLVPTILEVAGTRRFETWDGQPVPASPGTSLVPAFARDGALRHGELWWEHEGNRAIRAGDWKLVAAGGDGPWELYDLATDRNETRDLARERPEKARELEQRWRRLRDEFVALATRDPQPGQAAEPGQPVKELILPGESFLVAGRPAFILSPPEDKRRTPQPWVFYAPTLPPYPDRHERWMHEQFLAAGVAVAGIDVGEAYGSPQGRELFTALYRELTDRRGFAARPCLLGRSRGGLWVTSWAAENPDKVAGVAGIYPVFDLRTYPGLDKAAPAFGLTPAQLGERLGELNPIERVGVLAGRRVPALLIHGDQDKVVPLEANSAEFVARYRAAGAEDAVTLIVAKGQGHNFWEGYFRCRALVDFAIERARAGGETPARAAAPGGGEAATGTGALLLRIVEPRGSEIAVPVPARVHLADEKGKPVLAPGLPAFRDHFNCDGAVRLDLPPGRYTYTVERGPEYRRASGTLDLAAGETREREVRLRRIIDLAALGWYSGDPHAHRPPDDLPLLLRSEDLHVAPVLTVWNRRNHWKDRHLPGQLLFEVEPARVYHLLACEDERRGGALLYFNLRRPLDLVGDAPEDPSPVAHLREALEQEGAWIDVEKPFWWDLPAWVATGEVRSIGLANNHMCRRSMLDNEAWGRPRDVGEFPSPRGNGLYSQALYYRLLNCGLRIPPSAGSASGVLPNPAGYNRAYVQPDGPFSYDAWWRGLGDGRSFVTNGPLLLVEADGQRPGAVFRSPSERPLSLSLDIRVLGDDPLETVEVIRDGAVVERLTGADLGERVRPRPLVFDRSGWFLVRAIAAVPETFRFASTAPFYVEVGARRSTVHRDDVQFFLQWIDERIAALEKDRQGALADPARKEAVLRPHRDARLYFEQRLREAG